MIQSKTRWALMLALAVAIGVPGVAASQDKASASDIVMLSATVEDVDYAKRELTLKSEAGEIETFEVSPEVKRLKEVKKGDKIQVQVYRAVAAEMSRHSAQKMPSPTEEIQAAKSKASPGVAARREVKVTVTINNVDTVNNLVSVTGPRGFVSVLTVKRPEMKEFIKQLKRGDLVDVTFTEAVAISVIPASGK
jgi:hypothetical protein